MSRGILLTLLLGVIPAGAGELCFAPSTHVAGIGSNVSVNCTVDPSAFDNDWIGYSTDGPACGSGAAGCADAGDYLWTVSASATDPFVNSGPLPDTLYLWYVCTNLDGVSAAAFDLVGLEILGISLKNGILHLGSAPQFVLAIGGCPTGPLLVAELFMRYPTVSVDGSTWGGIKSIYR